LIYVDFVYCTNVLNRGNQEITQIWTYGQLPDQSIQGPVLLGELERICYQQGNNYCVICVFTRKLINFLKNMRYFLLTHENIDVLL